MIPLSLGEIAAVVGGAVEGDGAVTVTAPAVLDGRQAEPGGLFAAFAGEHVDGHDYAGQAREAGAVAVLGSRPTPLPTVVVEDAQAALQALAAHVVARLREGLTVAGLTGSQGKTSTKDLPKEGPLGFCYLSMTANGPELHAVPPSFTTGPPTTEIAGNVRPNPRAAIHRTEMWDDARKAHVLERWLYWQQVANSPSRNDFHTMEMGE